MSDRLDGWAAVNRPSGQQPWDISTAETQSIPVQGTPMPGALSQGTPFQGPQGMPAPGTPGGPGTPGVPTKPAPYRRGEETVATPTPAEPGPTPAPTVRRRAPKEPLSRRRRIIRLAIVTVSALLLASGSAYVWADTQLNREVDLGKSPDRPPPGKGTNYLIVGSDSREGLSEQARKNLRTGSAEGRRTDSMMVLHTGSNGTTMMSLPRDSWVTIPGFLRPDTGKTFAPSQNKLNAAYSMGGPDLLVSTIERNTGLRIDHYAEIGFSGFVDVVDAVGGVRMCVDRDIKDPKSGLDLQKGCHTLDGAKALAFVRQRKQEAKGDLGRTQNQQKFLAALADKAATPGVLANPFAAFPTVRAGLDTLIVDKDMGLRNLMSLFEAMKGVTSGGGRQLNVPVSNTNLRTSKGSAVQWNVTQARRLFDQLRNDQPVDVAPPTP
ncbi:LCP family protein [Streptomyces melanosporofaciens]